MKMLIINADDLGLCESVNQGILDCYNYGIVSDLSFIINPDYFKKSLQALKENNIFRIGLHLNLTLGSSLSGPVPRLTRKDGSFSRKHQLFSLYLMGILNIEGIYNEFKKQFQIVMDEGFQITHIDSHQNIHLIPPIYAQIVKLLDEFKLFVPIRFPMEKISNPLKYKPSNLIRVIILNTLSFIAGQKHRKFTTVETIGGNFYNNRKPDKVFNQVIKKILKSENTLFELAVHPGYYSLETSRYDSYNDKREMELTFLMNANLNQLETDLRIINYYDACNIE